jgi:hypothetical protein
MVITLELQFRALEAILWVENGKLETNTIAEEPNARSISPNSVHPNFETKLLMDLR